MKSLILYYIYSNHHNSILVSEIQRTFTPYTFYLVQLHCLRLLYAWRDNLARTEDESTGYVLPNHMLFQISEILPREAQGVLACCNPIPTLLRQQLQEVHMLVQKARETPLNEPVSYKNSVNYY